MKREHRHFRPPQQISAGGGGEGSMKSSVTVDSAGAGGKGEAWQDAAVLNDAGMDELLAVLGYKVKTSDMAEVAHKLEQLEEVIGNAQDQDGLCNLASDTVYYNPADLPKMVESMLAAAAQPVLDDPYFAPAESSTMDHSTVNHRRHQPQIYEDSSSEYDLKAIPGRAIYSCSSSSQTHTGRTRQVDEASPKRFKHSPTSTSSPSSYVVVTSSSTSSPSMWGTGTGSAVPGAAAAATRPVLLVDSQENGIRLVQALTACGEALQREELKVAELLVKQIRILATSQAGAMGKVGGYFANAIARRIYGVSPVQDPMDDLQMHFYEACPYLKFAHFTANQAILEAFAGKQQVHVVDFSMHQGMQWPMLMQALALRPGGPPSFRLTGIGPPSPDGSDRLQEVGWKLAQLAKSFHLKFHYRGFVAASLADLDPSTLDLDPSEAVAVNSVFELHRLLAVPGAIDKVLSAVGAMNPEIVTVVEQEASHNGPVFQDRFMEALHYYSTMFDSLEGAAAPPLPAPPLGGSPDMVMSEMYLGNQICNVVACEGADRVERHETLAQWRARFESAGFAPAHIGSNAYRQASVLLAMFAGGGDYRVEEDGGCLLLGWHTRPLIAASAWRLAGRGGAKQQIRLPS